MGAVGRRVKRTVVLTAAVFGALLLAFAPGVASGQAGGDEEKRRQAGQHVEEGDRFKEAGKFDEAAEEYRKAYDLVPHPLLLFNLAQVYRLGGDEEAALEHYEKYLAEDPEGPAADQARTFAEQLRAEIEASGRKKTTKRKGGGEGGGGGGSRAKWLRRGGMASAGLGAIFLGVGIKYGLDARSASDQISGHEGAWDKESLALEKAGPRAEKRFYIFSLLGVAAVAGGGVLYWMGMRADQEGTTVTPTASEDGAGVAVIGRF